MNLVVFYYSFRFFNSKKFIWVFEPIKAVSTPV